MIGRKNELIVWIWIYILSSVRAKSNQVYSQSQITHARPEWAFRSTISIVQLSEKTRKVKQKKKQPPEGELARRWGCNKSWRGKLYSQNSSYKNRTEHHQSTWERNQREITRAVPDQNHISLTVYYGLLTTELQKSNVRAPCEPTG